MATEVFMTRQGSVADAVGGLLKEAKTSVDAALYRFNNSGLAASLEEAARRGLKIRLVVDRGKYDADAVTRKLLSTNRVPFRALSGRRGTGSKMHHKFIILDGHAVLTGSYNWTTESEEENYDNLAVLRNPVAVESYRREFEALWGQASNPRT